jgi:hypothetical protein
MLVRRRSSRIGAGVATLGVAAVLVTGCSSSGHSSAARSSAAPSSGSARPALDVDRLSAAELFAEAKSAAAKADQLHVTGKADSDGDAVELDLSYAKTGTYGTVAIDGSKVTLLSREGHTWFKVGDDFWRKRLGARARTIIEVINGRWIKADPADRNFASLRGCAIIS